jgi:hypothetical protein
MVIKARDLLHEVLEGGDLDYQIYVVDEERDREYQIRSMKVYDDVIDIDIHTPFDDREKDKVVNSLEVIKDCLINGRRGLYGAYEVTRDIDKIIEALK